MSNPVVEVGNEKEKFHASAQGRQDQVHPSVDLSLTSLEYPSHRDDEGNNMSTEDNSTRFGEMKFSNGDFYAGSWRGSLPDGKGKYLWSDGCMYEGEWVSGKKMGRGKFSWPSGATYEGDFLGGYMDGVGFYTGVNGTTYKGGWRMNIKHGLGRKCYANGDVYQGSWKQGVHDGPGRYIWANGNVYMGDWKSGMACGKGKLMWASGDSFNGHWLDGLEHGIGVYTWADGGCFVGTWSRGLKDGKGTFYPPGTKPPKNMGFWGSLSPRNDIDTAIGKYKSNRLSFGRRSSSGADQHSAHIMHWLSRASSDKFLTDNFLMKAESLPSRSIAIDRHWSLEGSLEKIPSLDFGNLSLADGEPIWEDGEAKPETVRLPIVEREYMQGVLMSELVKDDLMSLSSKRVRRRHRRHAKEFKRPGETIIKGHRSYDLMLNLQLGIRYTVGKITREIDPEIKPSDFGPKAKLRMKFPREGSQLTPPHQSVDFKWGDYCPVVFRKLREMFRIDPADYMISACGNDALRELSSPGKSGSVFFLSNDDCFMIKTLRKSELKVLLRMLPTYFNHVCTYENTLITKFFGLHYVKPAGGQKVRFVVMGNIFCTELRIHRRFDLKGSLQGRSTNKIEIDETATLKDLDLNFSFYLEPSWREVLLKQVELDCTFLESQQIMDYSLLLGLHFRAPQYPKLNTGHPLLECVETADDALTIEEWTYPGGLVLVAHEPREGRSLGSHVRGTPLTAAVAGHEEVDLLLPGTARLQIQLGVNMPSRAVCRPHQATTDDDQEDEMFSEVYDVVLYFGIIDILQDYNVAKKIEHVYKSLQFDALSISVVSPQFYSERFQMFLQKIFPPNPA